MSTISNDKEHIECNASRVGGQTNAPQFGRVVPHAITFEIETIDTKESRQCIKEQLTKYWMR